MNSMFFLDVQDSFSYFGNYLTDISEFEKVWMEKLHKHFSGFVLIGSIWLEVIGC